MKNCLLLVGLSLFLIGCESDGELTRNEVGAYTLAPESVLQYSGSFIATSGINVTGTALIYKTGNRFKVLLDGFSISGGPDLKVYLSTSERPEMFINLGALGNGTSQSYLAPDGVDFTRYNHVLIHCQQYNHLYAVAALDEIN